jgi:phosphatidylinositol alpha-1,6-mannosyltransferase
VTLAYVSHSQPPAGAPLSNIGGMQRVAQELLVALQSRDDIAVDAIVLHSSWRWIHFKVFPFLLATYFRLIGRIEQGAIDTILFSSMVTALLVIPLERFLKIRGIRTAVIVHGLDITTPFSPYQGLVRSVFRRIDLVLPVSHATAAACMSRGLSPDRVHVVHNGVNTSRFDPHPAILPEKDPLRSQFDLREEDIQGSDPRGGDLPDDSFLLCSVGRHVLRKGYAWFIEFVMPKLSETVHYWLAGDGPEYDRIALAIRQNGLLDRVRLLGKLSDPELNALYRGSDLFVMPNIPVENDMEGFGIVMLEAGMNGLPSIAARLEGIQEVISEGQNGHFIEAQDADGFASRITEYVDGTRDLGPARERAFEYTRDTFGWETIANETVEALASLHSS